MTNAFELPQICDNVLTEDAFNSLVMRLEDSSMGKYGIEEFKYNNPLHGFIQNNVPGDLIYIAYVTMTAASCNVIHVDEDCHIALFHLCDERWNVDFGGETILLDKHGEIEHSILPKKNRLVIFEGDVPHAARNPTASHGMYRRTLVSRWQKRV